MSQARCEKMLRLRRGGCTGRAFTQPHLYVTVTYTSSIIMLLPLLISRDDRYSIVLMRLPHSIEYAFIPLSIRSTADLIGPGTRRLMLQSIIQVFPGQYWTVY